MDFVIFLLLLALAVVVVLGLLKGVFRAISLPLQRRERARILLDLVEIGLRTGHNPEEVLTHAALSRDTDLGPRLHLLSAHIESGLRMEAALARVPQLVPPQIAAMLKVGAQTGNLLQVLPACRRWLNDGLSHTRGAINYLVLLLTVILPVTPGLLLLLSVYVLPQFATLAAELGVTLPGPMLWLVHSIPLILGLYAGFWILLLVPLLMYSYGPFFRRHLGDASRARLDVLALRLPWRRRRAQRDFAAMLAILLDADMPEPAAVRLAAECTDNTWFRQAAERAVAHLEQGSPLLDALTEVDAARELNWRMRNARYGRTGFRTALSGWLEHLDAKAFQQEQAAAQCFTTGLVLFNGVLVGFVAVTIFSVLISIIQEGVLW